MLVACEINQVYSPPAVVVVMQNINMLYP